MKYKVLKLQFKTGLHIGNGLLSGSESVIYTDTLFSALCHEALNFPDGIRRLYEKCKTNRLKFSDALPFIGDTYYVPKPLLSISSEDEGNSVKKKAFKKLKYIPINLLQTYLNGNLDAEAESKKFQDFGSYEMRTSAKVNRDDDAEPFHVGCYHFNKGNGLYVCVGYEEEEDFDYFSELMECVSYAGIGGKRTSGYGKFNLKVVPVPKELERRLSGNAYADYISISLSMPQENELKRICGSSNYLLIKRSGFISSPYYENEFRKKQTFYGFASGSIFNVQFEGDIYDVSCGGKHPVYQYAIPFFMGVSSNG